VPAVTSAVSACRDSVLYLNDGKGMFRLLGVALVYGASFKGRSWAPL
jgi:hypothetical protein